MESEMIELQHRNRCDVFPSYEAAKAAFLKRCPRGVVGPQEWRPHQEAVIAYCFATPLAASQGENKAAAYIYG